MRQLQSFMLRLGHHGLKRSQASSSIQPCLPKPFCRARPTDIPFFNSSAKFMSTKGPSPSKEASEQTVEVLGHGRQKITRNIKPSYPDKPKAVANLLKYLSNIHLLDGPNGTAYSSHGWELKASGDLISRFAAFSSEEDLKQAQKEINAAASELNHHPTIFSDTVTKPSIPHLLVACTTHFPPGLSVKDAKLAKRVDEILENIGERDDSKDTVLNAVELLAQRQDARTYIETKVAEDCACSSGHEKSAG